MKITIEIELLEIYNMKECCGIEILKFKRTHGDKSLFALNYNREDKELWVDFLYFDFCFKTGKVSDINE